MVAEIQRIEEKLDLIKSELDYIKEHMVDVDMVLDEEDKKDLAEARRDFEKKETISIEDLKKELGI